MRQIMTEKQNEKNKRKLREALTDNRIICDVYPTVEKIIIEYTIKYQTPFPTDSVNESYTLTYSINHRNDYKIDCPNRECTQGFFDLNDVIFNMVREKEETQNGFLRCVGAEAPDHMYQSCPGVLTYVIRIQYK